MRVAFVLGSTPPRHQEEDDLQAAVETKGDWLGDEAAAVAALGHDVSVHLMYRKEGDVSHRGVDWFFRRPALTHRRLQKGKEYAPALFRSLEAWKPDLVHFQIISHAVNYALFVRWARKRGVPVVGQQHGYPISSFFWNNIPLGWAARHSDAVIFLTRYHQDLYCRKFKIPRERTHVIPVGYNEYFGPRDREACRAGTGLEGDPVIIWAAILNFRKDPMTVLRAFRGASARFPDARLYMAGSGPMEDEIRTLVAGDADLSRSVTLMGYVNNRDLPDFYNAADIYVMASHWEGFAISSMEAMACGAVPVLTNIPCFAEQTDGGRLGLLFEPGSERELEERLIHAIENRQWRETVRRALPEHIARYTWRASAEGLERLYESLIKRGDR
jgi:glycosyltransferase involved in cell wall biosynthesis